MHLQEHSLFGNILGSEGKKISRYILQNTTLISLNLLDTKNTTLNSVIILGREAMCNT